MDAEAVGKVARPAAAKEMDAVVGASEARWAAVQVAAVIWGA